MNWEQPSRLLTSNTSAERDQNNNHLSCPSQAPNLKKIFQLLSPSLQLQKYTTSDFQMSTSCLFSNIQSHISLPNVPWAHKKRHPMISIQCSYSLKLLTELNKVKGNINLMGWKEEPQTHPKVHCWYSAIGQSFIVTESISVKTKTCRTILPFEGKIL
jgi:hypothetical protein